MADHWKMALSPNSDFFFVLQLCLYSGAIFLIMDSFLYKCLIKFRLLFKFHGEIWWSQEQKENTPTILISAIILHALKYTPDVDFGKISEVKHIV